MPWILVPVLLIFLIDFTTAGNTTCAGNMTQWYTDAVGETACMTYQRLRQICNPTYQVPNFRVNTPGDQCDDQLQSCCCNSISWALSMLCMNCQWDVDGGPVAGIDAGVGAYGMYRSPNGPFCTPGTNQSLPSDIQSAVCNKGIKLADFLYGLFWNDGSWFYVYTMDTGVADEASTNNNMYTHCNSTISTTSTLSTSSTQSPSSTTLAQSHPTAAQVAPASSTSSSKTPMIVGAVTGSVVVLVAVAVAGFCWRKRQRRKLSLVSLDAGNAHAREMAAILPYTLSGSTLGNRAPYETERGRKHGQGRSNFSSSSPSTVAPPATVSESGQSSSDHLRNAYSPIDALRHEDAGAVPTLMRSGSGRLPPAYNPLWDALADETPPPSVNPDPEHQEGSSRSYMSNRRSSIRRSKR